MKPAAFEYLDPRSLADAVAALAQHGDEAKVLAGGQSLVPMLNFRLARPRVLVDINRISGLDTLTERNGVLAVGALVRQRMLERWAVKRAPLLAAGLGLVGHAAIRNRGTVAGSVVHADPAAELPALLVVLEGSVVARGPRGERVLSATEFFRGPLVTALAPEELVVETRWPLPTGAGWGLHEVARRHGDFALVGAIAVLQLQGGRVASVRVAVFGTGPTPQRVPDTEAAMLGREPAPALIEEAGRAGVERIETHDDIHATGAYRARVARTLIARALTDAVARAREAA